jgi:GNAT superfamily N-acetyltransferase
MQSADVFNTSSYSLVEGDPVAHKADVLALAERNLPGLTEQKFEKYYERHPLGRPIFVLAQDDESGRIVGMEAAFPAVLRAGKRSIRAVNTGDFAVDAEHRGFGPALLLHRRLLALLEEHGVEVAFGSPNRFSGAILNRMGYAQVGPYARFLKVLSASYFLERHLQGRVPAGVSPFASALVDPALRLASREKRVRHTYTVDRPSRFDERFARLVEEAAGEDGIRGIRTCELLNWRYEKSDGVAVELSYAILALLDGDDAVGYVVYRTVGRTRYILDALYGRAAGTAEALIAEFVRDARADRATAISALHLGGPNRLTRAFAEQGFLTRTSDWDVRVKVLPGAPSDAGLADARGWSFLFGENDI